MGFRDAIETDAQDLHLLAERAAESSGQGEFLPWRLTGGNDWLRQERELDAAAMTLRSAWLGVAHRPGDATLKSPRAGDVAQVACGSKVRFGYERDIDVALLEQRKDYVQAPSGWNSDLVLFRSGQAALACLIHFAAARWGVTGPLTVAHAGAYFETASLLASWPQRMIRQVHHVSSADIVLGEPVWCDGEFGCARVLPRARHALILDITMAGPAYDLAPHLEDCPLVIAYSSGLKLDQAGLELANAGIVRVLARKDGDATSEELRQLRALTGAGLTLDELSALSAPWFMDRVYADHYTAAIFANNRALAQAIGTRSPVFGARCHPSLAEPAADAPFCAVTLNAPSPEKYRALEVRVAQECERRGLLAVKGGSFGFRGHRFELIEPEQGKTFLRVALGWRDGWSREGLCELFGELAQDTKGAAGAP
jgi:hypothetical protein